ncbi:hypothetical protein [Lactiplantibacillus carotarum]|uniref:hypothetical protein n=1 Tax=Lactiplantibacillus carotarum TaxID=2993456 RepID=UPI00298F2F77|nr:hypothetical protein [Lactiplantibacillus carotarum]
MEITIDFIIATSGLLAILCWVLSGHYFREIRRGVASLWLVGGVLMAGLAGFFIWSAVPLWTSL